MIGTLVGAILLVSPSSLRAQAEAGADAQVLIPDEAVRRQLRDTSERRLAGLRRDAAAYYVGGILATVVGAGGIVGGLVEYVSSFGVGTGTLWFGPLVTALGVALWQGGLAMMVVGSQIDVETDRLHRSLELTIAPTEGGAMGSLTLRF